VNSQVTDWFESNARRVVDAQLAEAARIDAKARELLGFIGIVLALLGAAASQSGSVEGVFGGIYYGTAVSAVLLLVWAGYRAVQEVAGQPSDFSDIGVTALQEYREDPALAAMEVEELRGRAFKALSRAAQENVSVIVEAQERLAAVYGAFAVALAASGLAIVALVLSLV
jgi:hypothetical protein